MKMNIPKSFTRPKGSKTLYLMTFFTLVALTAVGFFVVPSYTGTSSAKGYAPEGEGQTVTTDMLKMALDLRSATDYSVYAELGVEDDGRSTIKGSKGVASRDAEQGERARKDFSYAFNIIDQLPSTEIKELTSGSFKAGVYSAPSARLSGEITLDAKDDANAIFIFRIAGALKAEDGARFNLVNGAKAHNVFFVAGDSAVIGKGVDFEGNVFAKGSIAAEKGAKVNGRTMSLNGAVKLTEAAVGGGTGVIEICKENTEPGLNVFAVTNPIGTGCAVPIPAGSQQLVRFNSFFNNVSTNGPNQPQAVGTITFPAGRTGEVVGIDFRPTTTNQITNTFQGPLTGTLFALVLRRGEAAGGLNALDIFTVNQATGALTFVRTLDAGFTGNCFGFDFENDFQALTMSVRITSNTGENAFANVDTGTVVFQAAFGAGNSPTGVASTIGQQAFNQPSPNQQPAQGTAPQFVIDAANDRLIRIDSTSGAVLQVVGQLGVDVTNVNGFDISQATSNGSPLNGTALAALTFNTGQLVDPNSPNATQTGLFQIDLQTGRATLISLIGAPGVGPTPQFPPTAATTSISGLAIGPGGSTGAGNPNGLANRIFQFRVGGRTVQVPVGACSGPLDLPAGPTVIEELTDGFLVGGGTFSGRFRLMNVTTRVAGGPETNLAGLTTAALATRTVTVNVVEGDINNQTVVTFFNTFAINAVIEICKNPAGSVTGTAPGTVFDGTGNTGTGVGLPAAQDVAGFFNFTVDVLPNTTFTIPVGACSGPIQVNVPTTPANVPAPADILVTEIGRTGFQLESATTFPADRFNFLALGVGINNTGTNPFGGTTGGLGNPNNCIGFSLDPFVPINQTNNGQNQSAQCVFSNPGGGVVSADVVEGGTSNQTTINFFNRAAPVELKICKVAGPGIPVGTEFNFEIRGTTQTTPATTNTSTTVPPGTVLGPGATSVRTGSMLRFLTVQAGPGEQGGFCDFVRNLDGTRATFVVGTNIAIAEVGFNGVIPGVPAGQVRTGSIRSNTPIPATTSTSGTLSVGNAAFTTPFTTAGAAANQLGEPNAQGTTALPNGFVNLNASLGGNPDLEFATPTATFVASAVITTARATQGTGPTSGPGGGFAQQKVEVEFTNFVFNPTTLKICKVAGAGVAVGTPFTFQVAVTNPSTGNTGTNAGPIFDPRLTTVTPVTVVAGPASQGGFCSFASGPFSSGGSATTFGAFNVGSTVTIQEVNTTNTPLGNTTVTSITSPTGTVLNPNNATRTGGLLLGFPGGFNELAFVNTAGTTATPTPTPGGATPTPVAPRAEFDFDGDGKSDPTIFRPSTTQWWFAASSAGGQHRSVQFGLANDTLVAADYDGDRKTDYAVFRGGVWFVMKSSDGTYRVEQFGTEGDIPQTGDFDADGKADLAVFRPSTGTWWINKSSEGISAVQFGLAGDKPVAADFDGDAKTDIANYRGGTWHLLKSTGGYTAFQFGIASDKPVVADYDGDRKADAAVYRDGIWHIMRTQAGYTSYQFGLASDKPVPADYNGDGKTDLAVFRNGTWHMLASGAGEAAGGYSTIDFGNATDVPAAAVR